MSIYQTPMLRIGDSLLGKAVFASRDIKGGEEIYRFSGPSVTFRESVASGPNECYSLQVDRDLYINPESPGKYINHSCDPNSGLRELVLVALRDIKEGEELSYDYSTTMLERHWVMDCRCGSPLCRHVIEDFDKIPEARQKYYLNLGVVQPFIVEFLEH